MKKIIISLALANFLIAGGVAVDNTITNSKSLNLKKNLERGKSKEKSKTKSTSKGIEFTKNKTQLKEKSKEITYSNDFTKSKSNSLKKSIVIEIPATQLLPEVDFLLNKIIDQLIEKDELFVKGFFFSTLSLPSGNDYLGSEAIQTTSQKLSKYLINYLKNYFAKKQYYSISTSFEGQPLFWEGGGFNSMQAFGFKGVFYLSGSITGAIPIDTRVRRFLEPLKLFGKNYFIFYDPQQNHYFFSFKNKKIIEFTPTLKSHFYGDLLFLKDLNSGTIKVIDLKLNVDSIYLDRKNVYYKFDKYFKKLMFIYLEAIKHLNTNSWYSFEEIKFRIREYIYNQFNADGMFLQKYLTNPKDFWRPKKDQLANIPTLNTSFGDVIFSKSEGIILNRTIKFNIVKDEAINQQFSQLFKKSATQRFARTIQKAINQFRKEHKDFAVKLTKSLAVKFANSKDFAKKQDLVNKASTSTDVLHTLLSIFK